MTKPDDFVPHDAPGHHVQGSTWVQVHRDDDGTWWRPNQHAGWLPGCPPAATGDVVYELFMAQAHAAGAIAGAEHERQQVLTLRARSARQTAHAARLERRVVRQRDALRVANEQIARLERWQAEATEVLVEWDRVHEALGSPAVVGESITAASLAEVRRLRGQS